MPGGCGGMLGSPPAAQRPVSSRGHWPNPPPAHTNGVVEGRYGGGEGVPLGFPRIPHPAAPYPHKVEEICGGSYIETKARKSHQPPSCLCKPPSTVWERESLVVAGCSRTTPLSLRGKQCGLLPSQHPSSPHLDNNSAATLQGSTSGGIPVGIAVARQRVQSTPPPPLTVVACEERSQQISGWPFPPPPNHWHYPGGGVDGPAVGLQLARDPLSGQLLLLPTPSAIDSMQRAVVWPGCGGGLPPPLQVMQQPQPLLLDRLVTLATPAQEKRRPVDEPLTSVMVPCDFSKNSGSCGGQGLALIQSLGGGPPHFPSLLIHQMPHNNSLLLTAEQSLNTSVVISSNQLSEIGPQVIGALEPSSLVISHTETNHSFVRSDINTVFPLPHHPPHHPHEDPIVIKEELKQEIQEKHLQSDKATSPATDLSLPSDSNAQLSDEETKEGACVQDASNQTETPTASDDDSAVPEKTEVAVKSESDRLEEEEGRLREETPPERQNGVKEETEARRVEEEQEEEEVQRHREEEEDDTAVPDLSGLELLSNSIAEYEAHNKSFLVEEPEESEEESRAVDGSVMLGGRLDLLCELAHQRFIEESLNNATEVKETWNEDTVPVPERPKEKRPKESKAKGNGDNVEWKMSELKRLYSETQKTKLTKVPPKKGPGRPKKNTNVAAKKPRLSTPSPAPSEPPVLEPSWCTSPSHKSGILSPPTLTPHKRKSSDSPAQDSDSSGSGKPPPLSPACSSSKKRKVGRPKKRPEKPVQTETLVSKSLRCSKTIVDLLLANQAKQDVPKPNKIRPKLKAEAKIKSWCDEDELEWNPSKENGSVEPLSDSLHSERQWSFKPKEKLSVESPKRVKTKKREEKECEKRHPRKPVKVLAPKLKRDSTEKPVVPDNVQPVKSIPECTLTIDHLDGLPCRVLVAMGGLFYAGQLTEVTPPDLYGVTLDKERGHRPHILCREQILTDAILEIRCDNLLLPSGTRLCAYWSQQYRCLYPGTVCADSSPDDKFICVEFDDGDNGKINRDDIRLLPHDYPIVEYDPNPLLTLGKRKRHNSTNSCDSQVKTIEVGESQAQSEPERVVKPEPVEEKPEPVEEKLEPVEEKPEPEPEPEPVAEPEPEATAEPEEEEPILVPEPEEVRTKPEEQFPFIASYDSEQERKRLKKKRREKLKQRLLESGDVRKHRHKHKESCSKESCKAKHKHKHKHRHRRHKHKHCKPLEPIGLVIENSNTESTETTTDPQEEDDLPPVIEPVEPVKAEVTKKVKDRKSRQGSVESKSKMAAFLPARQLWGWSGKGFKRGKGQGRRKTFYKAIQRGKETITVGDCAVFLSTGRPDRPYIGKIESMWECWGSNMLVRVSWFYHPEETIGCPDNLPYPGALFESPHNDENDVQTISHKCEVLPLSAYKEKLRECPQLLETVYDNNDTYYLAGYYDPTNITLRLEPGVGGK